MEGRKTLAWEPGDLVRVVGEPYDPVVGLVLEAREMPNRPVEVRVMWPDLPGLHRWIPVRDLQRVKECEE
jgi:hypothetical protein